MRHSNTEKTRLLTFFVVISTLCCSYLNVKAQTDIVTYGKTETEKANYAVSRYLFLSKEDIRLKIRSDYFQHASKELQILFDANDSIRVENYKGALKLVKRLESNNLGEDYMHSIAAIKAAIAIQKHGPDSGLAEINKIKWKEKSTLNKSTMLYILSKKISIAQDLNNTELFLQNARLNLRFQNLWFSEDITYHAYRSIARAFELIDFPDSTFKYHDRALKAAEMSADSVGLFLTNMDVAIFYSEMGHNAASATFFANAEKYIDKVSLRFKTALYVNSTICYRSLERFDIAEHYMKLTEEIALETGDTVLLGHLYRNKVAQFGVKGVLDSVPKYVHLASTCFESQQYPYGLAFLWIDYAEYFSEKSMLDSALNYIDKSDKLFKQMGMERGSVRCDFRRVDIYKTTGKWRLAEQLLAKNEERVKRLKDIDLRTELLNHLSWINEQKGNFQKAHVFLDSSYSLRDSAHNIELERKVSAMRLEMEKERFDRLRVKQELMAEKNKKAELDLAFQEELTWLLTAGMLVFIALFVLAGIMYFRMKQEKRKAELAVDQKEDLMNVVAHDLLAPIGKVSALSNLSRNTEDEEERENFNNLIDKTLNDGADMIRNLLDIHSAENKKLKVNLQLINIVDTLDSSVIGFRHKAEEKGIKLIEQFDYKGELISDPILLKRIVDNLLGNAIKFSKDGTEVKIKTQLKDKKVKLYVIDQGPGFSEKDKKELFSKFGKLSAQPTAKESSNGLGLAIVKNLLPLLKGAIELISEEGKGATFVVTFPVK